MTAARHHITIKGVKDGLIFVIDDQCDFEDVLTELRYKLEKSHQKILSGPIIHVQVKLGTRDATDEQKSQIREIIKQRGNLLIQSIESEAVEPEAPAVKIPFKLIRGIVRSGQTVEHDGNLLFIGDVNPGGTILCTGDIYILGSLRGMAHAGMNGGVQSIIAASHLKPTQLRIAHVISRPPSEWGIGDAYMEFAYLKEDTMEINKIQHLHGVRPGAEVYWGE